MAWHIVHLNPPCLAGSTLLPLTTSGGLSTAISPTVGRYGFVTIGASHWLCRVLVLNPRADAHSVDLLLLAFHRSSEHHSFLYHFERYDPDKLSSGCFDMSATTSSADQPQIRSSGCFFQSSAHFIFAPVSEKRMLITCCYFPSCFYVYPRLPLHY